MSFNLDVYFKPSDLQTLLSSNPSGVIIKCISVPNPTATQDPSPVLIAVAIAYDDQENAIDMVLGCPSPCKPGGGGGVTNCLNQNESLLQQLNLQYQGFNLNSLLE